jgi:hypothetical protein
MNDGGMIRLHMKKVGKAEKTEFTDMSLPWYERNLLMPFSLFAMFVNRGLKS